MEFDSQSSRTRSRKGGRPAVPGDPVPTLLHAVKGYLGHLHMSSPLSLPELPTPRQVGFFF